MKLKSKYPSKMDITSCRILVVGDVMLDKYWSGNVFRISPEAPVPVVHINSETEKLGGAANVALNIHALGANTTLIGSVGCDEAANRLRNLLVSAGVNFSFIEDENIQTIVKLRVIARNQQVLRIDFEKEPINEILELIIVNYEKQISNYDIVVRREVA